MFAEVLSASPFHRGTDSQPPSLMKRQAIEHTTTISKRAKTANDFSQTQSRRGHTDSDPGSRRSISNIIQNPVDDSGYIPCRIFMIWESRCSSRRMLLDVEDPDDAAGESKSTRVQVLFRGKCFQSLQQLGVQFDVQDELLLALRGFSFEVEQTPPDDLSWSGIILTYSVGTLIKFTKRSQRNLSDANYVVDTRSIFPEDEESRLRVEEPMWHAPPPSAVLPKQKLTPDSTFTNIATTLVKTELVADTVPTIVTNAKHAESKSESAQQRPKTKKERHKDRRKEHIVSRRQRSELQEVEMDVKSAPEIAKNSAPPASSIPRCDPKPIHAPTQPVFVPIEPIPSTSVISENAHSVPVNARQASLAGNPTSSKSISAAIATEVESEDRCGALKLTAGGDFAGRSYTSLQNIQERDVHTVAGVVTSIRDPKQTKKGDWIRFLRIVDPSSYEPEDKNFSFAREVSVNIFTSKQEFVPTAQEGDVIILVGVKGDSFNGQKSLTGPRNSATWAIYSSSSSKGFRHGEKDPVPGSGPSPFYEPKQEEVDYCRRLAEWWKATQENPRSGMVYQLTEDQACGRSLTQRPHLLLKDVNPSVHKFFDCTVEVLCCALSRDGSYILYVLDYTTNTTFSPSSLDPRGLSRSVLTIELSHDACGEGSGITPGIYSLGNVRVKVSGLDGCYEGNMQEKKIVKLNLIEAAYNDSLKALLERKVAWAKKYAPEQLSECYPPPEQVEEKPHNPMPQNAASSSPHTPSSMIKEIKVSRQCPDEFHLTGKVVDWHPHSLLDAAHRYCNKCDTDILGLQKICSRCKSDKSVRFVYEVDLKIEDAQGETIRVCMSDKHKLKDGKDIPFLQGLKRVNLKEDAETYEQFCRLFKNLVGTTQTRHADKLGSSPLLNMVVVSVPDAAWEDGRAYYLWNVEMIS
ncbi:hypothetical protein K435DRAFT_959989 [Dendrothele bispora CBS 962.96]|uniref:Telomeric single stranded DNA binding POT1/Cdc13 domain-containing protein n=1 Tax=Dendrothele bispora (strain CBS 962.96) TaxID=1314807 RepID=A0A4S8MW82_DENBC|nr:hypothetical protein K435DRAFT_959989 [Dendrothele bispora CBS 962.96]